MPNTRQVTNKLTNKKRNKWDEAIADAKMRIASLKKSIAVFEVRKAAGDHWPGDARRKSAAGL